MAAPAVHESYTGVATNSAFVTLVGCNTTQTDYIYLVSAYNEHAGVAAAAVTSITSTGLTFALRKRSNGSATGCLELWWAHGAGARTGIDIVVNFSGAYDDCSICVAVVTGCSASAPFDTNVSVPKAVSASTNSWTPVVTGVSTATATDLLLFLVGGVGGGGVPATGFTLVQTAHNAGGGWASINDFTVAAVSAIQSGASFTYGSSVGGFSATNVEAIFDALAPPAGAAAQARVMVMA